MKRSGALPQDWELTQCLFGEHLLPQCPGRSVALVESEKTATPEQREAHIDIADLLIADCPTVGHPALSHVSQLSPPVPPSGRGTGTKIHRIKHTPELLVKIYEIKNVSLRYK